MRCTTIAAHPVNGSIGVSGGVWIRQQRVNIVAGEVHRQQHHVAQQAQHEKQPQRKVEHADHDEAVDAAVLVNGKLVKKCNRGNPGKDACPGR